MLDMPDAPSNEVNYVFLHTSVSVLWYTALSVNPTVDSVGRLSYKRQT